MQLSLRVLVLVSCLAAGSHSQADEFRLWRDASGNFSVSAKLVQQNESHVQLVTDAGKTVTVPIAKLSTADRQFLKELSSNKPSPDAVAKGPAVAAGATPAQVQQAIRKALSGPPVEVKPDDTLEAFVSRLPFPARVADRSLNRLAMSSGLESSAGRAANTLADQLDEVLTSLELTWQFRQTICVISSLKPRRKMLSTVVYAGGRNVGIEHSQLTRIEPNTWDSLGGPGTFVVVGTYLVVHQTAQVHRLIEKELKLRPVPNRFAHALDRVPVTLNLNQTTLEDFAGMLSNQLGRPIRIEESQLAELGLSKQVPVSGNFTGNSARDVLDVVLSDIDCTWGERDNTIVIQTNESAERTPQTARVSFRINGLHPTDNTTLVHLLQRVVSPNSWVAFGGTGTVQPAGGGSYSVSQSYPVMREIMDLAATISSK